MSENAVKLPMATGSAWVVSDEDPATVPVAVPIILKKIEGPYTERDRKLWTFLLHTVWEELDDKIIHELSVAEINRLFRELGGQHSAAWIWESAERLAKTHVEWERVQGDDRYRGISSLFGAEVTIETMERGILRFHFPPLLLPILKDPRRFARLRTHVLIGLSGKYAVTLYEMLESVANMQKPVLRATLQDLRTWLKVPEGKYKVWADFKKRVLDPAIKQFNEHPDAGTGFTVQMKPIRKGKAINAVYFTVKKTKTRVTQEEQFKATQSQLSLFAIAIKPQTYETAKKYAVGWDIYALKAEWEEWGQRQKLWPPNNPDGAFINFCKKRGPYSRPNK